MSRIITKHFTTDRLIFDEIDVAFTRLSVSPAPTGDITPPIPTPPTSVPDPIVYPTVKGDGLQSVYKWNGEKDKTLTITINVSEDAQYLKYYFNGQSANNSDGYIKSAVEDGKAVIRLEYPGKIGRYELGLVAGNNSVGDGTLTTLVVEIYAERYYGTPDITVISYTKTLTEADLKPLEFNFSFDLQTVNSEGVEIFLGNDTTTPIKDVPVSEGLAKVVFYAKDLYNLYKNRFGETSEGYNPIFSFRPYFYSVAGKETGKLEVAQVSVTKTKFLLSNEQAVEQFSTPFSKLLSEKYESKITFEDERHLYYRIKYQDTSFNAFVIANIGEDDVTYSVEKGKVVKTEFELDPITGDTVRKQKTPYSSLILKLVEPIPATIEQNVQVWISKQILPTVIEDILLTGEDTDSCVTLLPNFGADVLDEMGYEYFDSIVGTNPSTSTGLVNQYLSQSKFTLEELNIQYISGSDFSNENFIQFQNFINFSGAKTRIQNFEYKLDSIKFWETKSSTLNQSTSSISLSTSKSYSDKITGIVNSFDGFERTLYNDYNVTSSVSTFFDEQYRYAEVYDGQNKNYLIRHLPRFIVEGSDQNQSPEFVLFVEMVGQHFDILWSYITAIRRVRNIRSVNTEGVNDKLVYTLLQNLGWDADNPFASQQLWLDSFGLNEDGSQPTNRNQLGENIVPIYTPEQAKRQVWRRILNNLPYLLKHKGTRRSVNALLACYGIPSSLLSIVEFGGPAQDTDALIKYTYEDRTAALNLSNTEYITTQWKDNAAAVQVRFRTVDKTSTRQLLRVVGGNGWDWKVELIPAQTASFGTVRLTIGGQQKHCPAPGVLNPALTSTVIEVTGSVIYDGYYKNITVQREKWVSGSYTNYDRYSLYVQEGLDDRIIMSQVVSVDMQTQGPIPPIAGNYYWYDNAWDSTGSLFIGSDTVGRLGLSGSIDDFRIWNTALSQSVIDAHTLNSDVIWGNDIYGNTENLLLRLDFEYAKNRQSGSGDPYIRNVAPGVQFTSTLDANGKQTITSGYTGWVTASIATSASTYPYQYDVYERVVSALAPPVGFIPADKVRLEDIELTGELSYRQRSTVKSLDRAPIDSNRLGLFFSPIKDLNLDILKSLGPVNVGDYIGDWDEEYDTSEYKQLDHLRHYYFKRIHLNIDEYINLIKSIDRSLYAMIEQLIPARASLVTGLLIEPSLLERNKVRIHKPKAENNVYTASIQNDDTTEIHFEITPIDAIIDEDSETELIVDVETKSAEIDAKDVLIPFADISNLSASISTEKDDILLADYLSKETEIDCGLWEATIIGEYDLETAYESAGNDADSPFVKGFGLMGYRGAVDRTYYRADGTLVLSERSNSYILKIKYERNVPDTDIDGNTTEELVPRYEYKLILVSQNDPKAGGAYRTPTQHSFYTEILANLGTFPYGKGIVVDIQLFDGYTSGHYRYTGDASTGLQNSFFNGSKQTILTTTDNAPAWEVFSTNPNRLKVNDTGRGSGEPILMTE